eukprot:Opistho-1_new@6050
MHAACLQDGPVRHPSTDRVVAEQQRHHRSPVQRLPRGNVHGCVRRRARCKSCPPGTHNPTRGATTGNACVPCPAGTYSNAFGSEKCKPCLMTEGGRTVSDVCPEGSSHPQQVQWRTLGTAASNERPSAHIRTEEQIQAQQAQPRDHYIIPAAVVVGYLAVSAILLALVSLKVGDERSLVWRFDIVFADPPRDIVVAEADPRRPEAPRTLHRNGDRMRVHFSLLAILGIVAVTAYSTQDYFRYVESETDEFVPIQGDEVTPVRTLLQRPPYPRIDIAFLGSSADVADIEISAINPPMYSALI